MKCCCPFQYQALREKIGQLEEKQQQELNCQKSKHRQEMENYAAEQLTLREEQRKELAQVHIEKFSAMAAELSLLHKVRNSGVFLEVAQLLGISNQICQLFSFTASRSQSELTAQKEALDTDHRSALEKLKKQVQTFTLSLFLQHEQVSSLFSD